jgi:hypothetical protein
MVIVHDPMEIFTSVGWKRTETQNLFLHSMYSLEFVSTGKNPLNIIITTLSLFHSEIVYK